MSLEKFAVVLDSKSLVQEFGPFFVGKSGVCRVSNDMAETQIVPDFMVDGFIGQHPRVPSVGNAAPLLLPFHAEIEALRRIRIEAETLQALESTTLPPFFRRVNAMEFGHLTLRLNDPFLDVEMGASIVERLSLREGDRLSLAVSFDGAGFCLHFDRDGNELTGFEQKEGWLATRFAVPVGMFGTPAEFAAIVGRPLNVPFEIRENRIHFQMGDVLGRKSYWLGEQQAESENDAILDQEVDELIEPLSGGSLAYFIGRWSLFFPYG